MFVASAVEVASFDWVTLPPLPGLHTRTGSAVLLAPTCFADESAALSWPTLDSWPRAWTAGPEQPHDEPDCVCVPVWVGVAVLVASAVEVASFD